MRRALRVGSVALVLVSLVWGGYFAWQGDTLLVAANLLMGGTGAWCVRLARRGDTRGASLLLVGMLLLVLCLMCVFLDIPSPRAPRVTHHYLLALGATALLLFRNDRPWLRHGAPLLCFAAFFVFGSTQWGIVTPHALPDELRVLGSWANSAMAMAVMYALLYVMLSEVAEHKAMVADLRRALQDPQQQFALVYQPQVDTAGRVRGAEALLRWTHPGRGPVSPAEFIPVAEQSGQILPLGHWVLGRACAQLVAWAEHPQLRELTLSVNVSAQQFRQRDFVPQLLSILQRSGARPGRLKLELTESMLVNDLDDIVAKMRILKAEGVGLSLDDFGTGYSSLSYLKQLPLDELKVDKSFVQDVLENPQDAAIARTVTTLGLTMGLSVIAEGVETAGQRDFLAGIGCRAFQGYLYSKPLPAAEFDAYAERQALQRAA
ncbi:EAL domain-containing protein [Roseateles sp. DAIF2]|nr:EAL domain-containing protein [Roseateles sp. DAIF2]